MICGHFRLLDGHIYYGNKIIKVRYDLLESMKPHQLTEENFFDFYEEVLPIRQGMRIASDSFLISE